MEAGVFFCSVFLIYIQQLNDKFLIIFTKYWTNESGMENQLVGSIITPILEKRKWKFAEIQKLKC